jgi:aminoglycoside phosphotransferase (APT) family kinase protein
VLGSAGVSDASLASDVIDVRPDERFDERRLAEWLRGRLEGAELPLRVAQFPGGHANLTYLLRFGEGPGVREYVLRRPPLGPVAATAHDMHREYRALSRLWRGFPLAPRAFLYCADRDLIGADFLVMERRHGVVVRGTIPPSFGGGDDPVANRKLSEVVIDTLAEFHAVDPAAVELQDLGKPEGFLERQVKGWMGRLERAKTREVPIAREVVRWLEANLPASPPPTLVHNDWRLDNLAVAPDDPGRCVAVYDWDMCTVGDPLCDLGTLLSMWSERGEAPAGTNPMPSQSEGFLTRDDAARRYAERSGRSIDALPYYVVFGTFKMGVVLQQIFVRFHRGQTQDSRFEGMGEAAEGLFRLAAQRRR